MGIRSTSLLLSDLICASSYPQQPLWLTSAHIWQFRRALLLLGGRGQVKINFQQSREREGEEERKKHGSANLSQDQLGGQEKSQALSLYVLYADF